MYYYEWSVAKMVKNGHCKNTAIGIQIALHTQDVNWTYIRRSEDIQDIFWTFYVRSIYVLCLQGGDIFFFFTY